MDEDANWLSVWVKYWNNVDLLEGAMEQTIWKRCRHREAFK